MFQGALRRLWSPRDPDSPAEPKLCETCQVVNVDKLCGTHGCAHITSGHTLYRTARKCQLCAVILRSIGNWKDIGNIILYLESDTGSSVGSVGSLAKARLVVRHIRSSDMFLRYNPIFITALNITTNEG